MCVYIEIVFVPFLIWIGINCTIFSKSSSNLLNYSWLNNLKTILLRHASFMFVYTSCAQTTNTPNRIFYAVFTVWYCSITNLRYKYTYNYLLPRKKIDKISTKTHLVALRRKRQGTHFTLIPLNHSAHRVTVLFVYVCTYRCDDLESLSCLYNCDSPSSFTVPIFNFIL